MYKIGDFSKKTNVPIKTLRYYDEINLFKPSYQDYFTGYRYYENNQIDEIKNIVMKPNSTEEHSIYVEAEIEIL